VELSGLFSWLFLDSPHFLPFSLSIPLLLLPLLSTPSRSLQLPPTRREISSSTTALRNSWDQQMLDEPVKALPRGREESCFLQGRLMIKARFLPAEPLPLGRFVPEPWPTKLKPVVKEGSAWLKRRREKERKRPEKARRKERKRCLKRRQKTSP
jgi:hypothetical protein